MTFSRNLTQNLKGYDIDLAHSLGISSSFAEVRRPRRIYFSQHRAEPLADCEAQNSGISSYTFLTYYSTYWRVTFWVIIFLAYGQHQERERTTIVGWRLVVVFQLHRSCPWGHHISSLEWLQLSLHISFINIIGCRFGWRRPTYTVVSHRIQRVIGLTNSKLEIWH